LLRLALDLLAQQLHLAVGQELGQRIGWLEAFDAQQGLRHRVAFLLQKNQEAAQGVDIAVDAVDGMTVLEAEVHIVGLTE
jgi:hypothetical protein